MENDLPNSSQAAKKSLFFYSRYPLNEMTCQGKKQHWEKFWSKEENQSYWTRPDRLVLKFIQFQSPVKHPSILDLGCGLGRHAIAFAREGFSVLATDSSVQATEFLKRWAEKEKFDIKTKVSGLLDPQIPLASFNIVISFII